nr:unnamed protein product [Trichobilharzia regenti]
MISELLNPITVIPEEQETHEEGEEDKEDKEKSQVGVFTPEHTSSMNVSNEPQSLSRLRNLYDIVHDLKIRLDSVRFTQHSFVEMINRSLSTAGIDASIRLSPVQDKVDNHVNFNSSEVNNEEYHGKVSSHPNGVHQSIELAVDRCSLVSADSQVKEFHDESGLNQTVAELWGGCPKSPVRRHHEGEIITRLNKKFSKPLVQKAVHKIKGLSLKPKMSCVPHIKNRDKNLIGSTTFCAGDMDSSLQESMLSKGLSCNLDVGENNGDTLMTRRVGDLVAVGEITIVELEHRDIFERLACAMAKLRDAIDECSDVSSAFWDVDIKNNLSALLTTSCADASQIYSAQDQNQSFDIKASRGPKDTSNIVNSLQTHNSSQITNASDNFDDAIVTPDYDSIDFFAHNGNEIKSNQLYGSVGHDSQKGSNQSDQYCKQLERKLCDMMREHEQLAVKLKEATEKLARVQEENHNLETEYRSLHRQLSYPSSDTGDNKCETVNTTPDTNDDNNNNHNHNQLTENKSIQFESNDTDTTEHQYHDQNHELDLIRIELANKQELIQSLEFDHAYILNKLSLLDYHDNNDGDDKENNNCHSKMIITELIDATVAEIFASRTLITDLQYQINEFEKRFNDSIPKDDYHQLEEQVNSLRLELDQVYSEVECYKSKMKLISSSFEPLLCIEKSVSLNELIDGILNKFHEQENRINSMQIDKENAFSAMKDCLASSSTSTFDVQQIPDSLTKCIELISSESSNLRDLIRDLHLDRKEAINLLKQLTSDNDNNDLHSISDYVNWFIDLFNETQNQLNDMEQLYAVTKTSLSTCLNKFKKLEEDSKSMEEKLSEYCYRLKSCQLRLEEIVKTCIIPSTTVHNNVLKSLREAETSCNELKLKNLKYEQEFQCIGKIVGEALAKSVELDNLSDDIAEICSSLTSYRNISSIADKRSKEWEVKYNNIHNELIERNAEIDRLQNTIHSRDANIKMLTETVKGNQEFTEEIEQELYRLRQEHINCPGQHELINVQTSPIVLSLDRIHDVGTEISMIDLGVDKATDNGSVSCANNLRLRKYGELRTAAFEIKEKLIQRTEKLESALEEVARLRSVIQQDKERASITLKEVEDLREQVIRKNRKIQSLEAKVARLRSSPSKANDALLSRIRSPCHPLSAKENPRNAVCSRTTATTTGLLFQSNNSAISPDIPCCDHVVKPLSDCTNLLTLSCDDSFSNNVPSLDNEQLLSPAEPSQINHCDDLTSLISNLQSLIDELMKRSVSLNGCLKCYLSENSPNLISNNIPDDAVGSSCSNSAIYPKHSTSSWIDNDASFRLSSPSSINQPLESHSPPPHIDGACLKSHVKSLQKTQEKLREISGKMDQLCSKFMRQCDQHLTCQVNYK